MKQYLPPKPINFGFKVWGQASTNGFLHDFNFYQGKANKSTKKDAEESGVTLTSQVVLDFCREIPARSGYKLFADNLFSSYNLVRTLSESGYFYCGTVRANRVGGAPISNKKEMKALGRGAIRELAERKSNIVVTQWQDGNTVNLISNFIGAAPINECRRYDKRAKATNTIPQPASITEYNKMMGGVDLSDMLRSMYAASLKCRRFYIYIFMYLLHLAARNAWIYHRMCCNGQETLPLADFLEEVARGLMYAKPKKPTKKLSLPTKVQTTKHLPFSQQYIGNCNFCTNAIKRHRTKIKCVTCDKFFCCTAERNCFFQAHILMLDEQSK